MSRRATTGLSIYENPSETQKPEFMDKMGRCVWRLVFLESEEPKDYAGYQFWGVCVSRSGFILTIASVFAPNHIQTFFNREDIQGAFLLHDNQYSDPIPLELVASDDDHNLAVLSPKYPSTDHAFDYCAISKDVITLDLPVATVLHNGRQYGLAIGNVVTATQKYNNIKVDQRSWNDAFSMEAIPRSRQPMIGPPPPPPRSMDRPCLRPELTLTEISGFPMSDDGKCHLLGQPVFMYDGRLIGLISVHGENSCFAVNFKYLKGLLAQKEMIEKAVEIV